jgi:hypothetical protein
MKEISSENKEIQPKKDLGKSMEFARRMNDLKKDPKVQEGAVAFTRTILNTGISLADFIPGGFGEILDFTATVAKTFKRKSGEKPDSSKISIDLTPDVPTWVLWVLEAPEIPTMGAWPSYLIPTIYQGIYDVPKIIEGTKQAIKIVKGETDDYSQNKTEIDEALNVFPPNE